MIVYVIRGKHTLISSSCFVFLQTESVLSGKLNDSFGFETLGKLVQNSVHNSRNFSFMFLLKVKVLKIVKFLILGSTYWHMEVNYKVGFASNDRKCLVSIRLEIEAIASRKDF